MGQFQAGSTMVAPSILMAIGLIRMLMPRIIKPILGLLIGTALMIATYGSAAMGSASAINLLMKMTLPSFNVAVEKAQPAVDRLQTGNPQPRGLVVLLGFPPVVAFQVLLIGVFGFFGNPVVRLIVDGQDVLHAHQAGHDPLDHLALGFQRFRGLAGAALEQLPPTLGQFDPLAQAGRRGS